MSLTIKTNLASLIAQSSLTNSTNKLNQTIERMTTGLKINHASDNAANYSISTNMTTKINAYQVAEDNVSMGLDLVQTASSTLESMGDLTTRLRALATQAQNGTYGTQSINALTKEANAIVAEINRLQTTAEYNGIKLFANTATQSLDPTNPIATYSGDVAVQSSSAKFIAPITRRDTSSMTKLADVDENTSLTSGTYSISTAEELAKLATMTNNGKIGKNTEFVLANDIDLSAYSTGEGWTPIGTVSNGFIATFDGNGYTISNLFINRPNTNYQGLFGYCDNPYSHTCKLSSIALENVNVTGEVNTGGLAGAGGYKSIITNCYVSGTVTGKNYTGGLCGSTSYNTITDSYATVTVVGGDYVGGFTGRVSNSTITNCYASGSASGGTYTGGLLGNGSKSIITNCYATGNVNGVFHTGGLLGNGDEATIAKSFATGNVIGGDMTAGLVASGVSAITDSYAMGLIKGGSFTFGLVYWGTKMENVYFADTTGYSSGDNKDLSEKVTVTELNDLIAQGILPAYPGYAPPTPTTGDGLILQVGVNANESSQITLTIQGIDLSALNNLDLQSDTIFETLDTILAKINDQQTSLGAVQNRLMSALDEISTQYENLVSSRSTLRDADIADVSSDYIKMQILQNASATLMSTANQSPALALQLL